jgi:hypothetical protein
MSTSTAEKPMETKAAPKRTADEWRQEFQKLGKQFAELRAEIERATRLS